MAAGYRYQEYSEQGGSHTLPDMTTDERVGVTSGGGFTGLALFIAVMSLGIWMFKPRD
jgi:hypothetical protein